MSISASSKKTEDDMEGVSVRRTDNCFAVTNGQVKAVLARAFMLLSVAIAIVCTTVPGYAGASYDIAYYQGFVTADRGNALVDKRYVIYAERGVDIEDGIMWEHLQHGIAIYYHTTASGLTLMSDWYWEGDTSSWVYSGTTIFRITPTSVVYLGKYDGDTGIAYAFEKGMAIPRLLGQNQAVVFKPQVTISGTRYDLTFSYRIDTTGLVVTSAYQPSGQNLTGCIQAQSSESAPQALRMNDFICCPGTGPIIQSHAARDDTDTNVLPFGDTFISYRSKVTDWGTGTPSGVNDFFTSSGVTEAQIESAVEAMTLPTQTLGPSSGVTAVIPLVE
jgi:hypothetical protein